MNRSQLEHVIRAAATIAGDTEIVVIGDSLAFGFGAPDDTQWAQRVGSLRRSEKGMDGMGSSLCRGGTDTGYSRDTCATDAPAGSSSSGRADGEPPARGRPAGASTTKSTTRFRRKTTMPYRKPAG